MFQNTCKVQLRALLAGYKKFRTTPFKSSSTSHLGDAHILYLAMIYKNPNDAIQKWSNSDHVIFSSDVANDN
jgi:hypothetical protein